MRRLLSGSYRVILVLGFAAFLFVSVAEAQITLGQPKPAGHPDYCGVNNVHATLSPDNQELSVIYDNYVVSLPEEGDTPSEYDGLVHKGRLCSLRVPVKVAPGHQFMLVKVDYRGFVDLPAGASARFSSTINGDYRYGKNDMYVKPLIMGAVREEKVFAGPVSEEVFLSKAVTAGVWSPCGKEVGLWIGSQFWVAAPPEASAYAAIDTADLSASAKRGGVKFRLMTRKCKK